MLNITDVSGTLRHSFFVIDVSARSRVYEKDMIKDQTRNGLAFLIRKACLLKQTPYDPGSSTCMVAISMPAFAHIVQKACPQEKYRLAQVSENIRVKSVRAFRHGVAQGLQSLHCSQGMLVYRIDVVLIILNPVDNPFHLRDEGDHHAGVQHFVQYIEGPGRRGENPLKCPDNRAGLSKVVIDEVRELLYETACFYAQGEPKDGALLEYPY